MENDAIVLVNQVEHEGEKIPHHRSNKGVLLAVDGKSQEIVTCWCQLRSLVFKTKDLIVEVIKKEDEEEPLQCYRLLKVPENMPINKLATQAFKWTIKGPVFLRYQKKDADKKEILDYLLSADT